MKKFLTTSILAVLVAFGTTVMAQEYPDEYLGLPGDNLNLYATMKLFQGSETLEGFEKSLNEENSRINNLDLNGDNLIDYITVSDYVDGDVHTIVLRAMLNQNESQDVAVFTVQRFSNGSVQIQLIGDEDLYGKNYIIEPIYDETPNPGYTGRANTRVNVTVVRTTPYEIAAWPVVRFIYLPNYSIWHSSWYWGYYPNYWNPWRPYYWHYYYGYHYNWYNDYYGHYRHWDHYRYARYNDFYYHGFRSYSPAVVVNINKGSYKTTYSHPEQRKEGEALYSRVNPGQPRRAESTSREQTTNRASSGNRSQETRVNQGQTKNTADRKTPPAYGRTKTRPVQSQGTETVRTERKSTQKANTSRPAQSQKSEASRSTRQSAPKATPSQSKSTRESKPASSGEKRESKDSKSKSSSRSR